MNTESKSAKQKGKLSAFEPYMLMAYDIAATFIAVFIASWGTQHWATLSGAAGACPAILVLALVNVVVFWFFHMYSSLWRYASISEAGRIVAAVTVGSVIGDVIFNVLFGKGMTLREDVMAWAVVLIICGGGRFAIRAIYGSQLWRFKSNSDAHLPRTLIVGAGETGSLSIKRMLNGDPDMIGDPVAVVDDDPNKQNQRIHDVKVCGTCADIPTIAHDCEAEQIVVAIPSATHEERQRIYDLCMKNVSGILSGGVIGGLEQTGNYKMDVRFNRRTLKKKVMDIAARRDDIEVTRLDAEDFIDDRMGDSELFAYLDPPYVQKGPGLYRSAFDEAKHRSLARKVGDARSKWVVTYDADKFIDDIYGNYERGDLEISYTANVKTVGREKIILGPGLVWPEEL